MVMRNGVRLRVVTRFHVYGYAEAARTQLNLRTARHMLWLPGSDLNTGVTLIAP